MFIRLSYSQEVVTRNLNGEGRKLLTLEKATKILVIFSKELHFQNCGPRECKEELHRFIRYSYLNGVFFFREGEDCYIVIIRDFGNWIQNRSKHFIYEIIC